VNNVYNINAIDNDGNTALHLACKINDIDIIELLCDYKANPNMLNNNMDSLFHIVVTNMNEYVKNNVNVSVERLQKYYDIVKILLQTENNSPLFINQICNKHPVVNLSPDNILLLMGPNGNNIKKLFDDYYNYYLLHNALNPSNIEQLQILIERKVSLETRNMDDCTPLMTAALKGNIDAIELLLSKGANINAKCEYDNSLIFAIQNKHTNIAHLLIGNNIDIDNTIIDACKNIELSVVRHLIEKGADVNEHDDDEMTALNYMSEQDFTKLTKTEQDAVLEIIKLLALNGADMEHMNEFTGYTPLMAAINNNNDKIVKLLIELGAEIDPDNEGEYETPLMLACDRNNFIIMWLLIMKGVDIDVVANGQGNALNIAYNADNFACVDYLLSRGVNVNEQVYKILLEHYETILMLACAKKQELFVRKLLEHDVDMTLTNERGDSALVYAIYGNNPKIVKMLLDNGIDVNNVNDTHNTALHIVCNVDKPNKIIIKLLIDGNADVNIINSMGYTALTCACRSGSYDAVKLLLDKGCDVNHKAHNGDTPLTIAAQANNISIMNLLITNGATNPINPVKRQKR
jgi:ankyrin repeat protein